MAAYIAKNNTRIPDSQFSCPSNSSGIAYASIPWSNMSDSVFGRHGPRAYLGFCGIKGPHPRMNYCCQNGQLSPDHVPDDYVQVALAAEDQCSQYCPFAFANMDLWLYCLTKEGDTVSNAFCRSTNGDYVMTSGTLERKGPFDPNSDLIKDKKSAAVELRPRAGRAWLASGAMVAALWIIDSM